MVNLQPEVKDIIKKVAKKYNITFTEAHQMYSAYYEVLRLGISSGDKKTHEYPTINMLGFGRFRVPERTIIFWKNYEKKKQEEAINIEEEKV